MWAGTSRFVNFSVNDSEIFHEKFCMQNADFNTIMHELSYWILPHIFVCRIWLLSWCNTERFSKTIRNATGGQINQISCNFICIANRCWISSRVTSTLPTGKSIFFLAKREFNIIIHVQPSALRRHKFLSRIPWFHRWGFQTSVLQGV
jgi:hypothetical protein